MWGRVHGVSTGSREVSTDTEGGITGTRGVSTVYVWMKYVYVLVIMKIQ